MTSSTFDHDLPGLREALAGQYTLERELGRGGMGIVLLARDEKLDRRVALKVLPPALATQPDTRERFLREARTAAQLSHPNIVPVFRADELGGYAFFAMGFVDGESLGSRVAARGALPAAEAVRFLREAAWALAYAHARGVVHRDVKPENLLVERATGRVMVTDFGIARAPEASRLTQTGHVMGSVHWMSPEQGSGDALDGRSDLYSLGAVGFFLLAGRPPFEHESAAAILVARATKPAPMLRSVAPDAPAPVASVIDRCLRASPDDRPRSGEVLADELEAALRASEESAAASGGASGPQRVLNEDEAQAVWRRAAQLQAEAASRLEARARETRSLPAATSSDAAPAGGDSATGLTSGFRARDVAQAAVEAGISQQYVAVAMAELESKGSTALATSSEGTSDRAAKIVLGTDRRVISVTRQFRHAPAKVLAAMGRAFQGDRLGLRLAETLGGHPLDGGVLLFRVPDMTGTERAGYQWSWTRYQTFAKELRAVMRVQPGDSSRCEVTLTVDLVPGRSTAMWESLGFAGGGSFVGSIVGAALGKKAAWMIALTASAGLVPVGGGMLIAGSVAAVLGAAGLRWAYRHSMGATERELSEALKEIESELTKTAVFLGDPFAPPPPPRDDRRVGSSGDDVVVIV